MAPPPAAQPAPAAIPRISWLGLMGGLLGAVPLAALGVEVLVEPADVGRGIGFVLLAMALPYLLAVWVSVTRTSRRRFFQRGVVVASILMGTVGMSFIGAEIAILLMPATALLAIASGLVVSR